jgi:hypothetical protein
MRCCSGEPASEATSLTLTRQSRKYGQLDCELVGRSSAEYRAGGLTGGASDVEWGE